MMTESANNKAIVTIGHFEFIVTVPKFIPEGNIGWVEHPIAFFENELDAESFKDEYNKQ